MNPTISLCMIVKDEERFLSKCLESVCELVDEIVVVDTGSKDKTIDIARRFGSRVFEHPWENDFSEARNFSLNQSKSDWILILDADEEIIQEDSCLIRRFVKTQDIVAFSFVNLNPMPDGSICRHRNVRLFRRGNVHYEGIVHNVPIVQGPIALSPIRVYHHGYNLSQEEMKKKYKRSECLLVKQVQNEPENTYSRAHLIHNYRCQKEFQKLIAEAEKTLSISNIPLFNRQIIMNDLLYGYFVTNNLQKAEKIGLLGLQDNPLHIDMLFVLGGVMVKQKKIEKAIAYFKKYLEVRESDEETPGLEGLIIDTYGFQGRAWNNIGSCYLELGMVDQAIDAYKRAISYEKTNNLFYKNLAGLYVQKGWHELAVKVLEQAVDFGIADGVIERSLEELKAFKLNSS